MSARRYRVTVDQAAIEAGEPAIHVHDVEGGSSFNTAGPIVLEDATFWQSPPADAQQDGARVWAECDVYWYGASAPNFV